MALGLPSYRLLVKSKARASLKPSPECLPTPFWMHCLRGSSYPEYFITHQIQSWCFVPTWNDYSRPACANLENCTKSWRRADPKQGVIFISLYMEIKHTHTPCFLLSPPPTFSLIISNFKNALEGPNNFSFCYGTLLSENLSSKHSKLQGAFKILPFVFMKFFYLSVFLFWDKDHSLLKFGAIY